MQFPKSPALHTHMGEKKNVKYIHLDQTSW